MPVGLEPLQRCLSHVADVRGTAVEARLLTVLELETELGRNHHLIAERAQRLADQLFVREGPVGFGRVEERHARIDGRPDDRDAGLSIRGRAVSEAESHAPEAECRHLHSALS